MFRMAVLILYKNKFNLRHTTNQSNTAGQALLISTRPAREDHGDPLLLNGSGARSCSSWWVRRAEHPAKRTGQWPETGLLLPYPMIKTMSFYSFNARGSEFLQRKGSILSTWGQGGKCKIHTKKIPLGEQNTVMSWHLRALCLMLELLR